MAPSGSGSAIGIAALALQRDAEMRRQRTDRTALLRVGIVVRGADDDRAEAAIVMAFRRQHRRRQRVALVIAQCQEQRHGPLQMRVEPDLLLDEAARRRLIALRRLLALLSKKLLDRMPHGIGLDAGFRLRLDAEPGLAARRVANIFHASSATLTTRLARFAAQGKRLVPARARQRNSRTAGVYGL